MSSLTAQVTIYTSQICITTNNNKKTWKLLSAQSVLVNTYTYSSTWQNTSACKNKVPQLIIDSLFAINEYIKITPSADIESIWPMLSCLYQHPTRHWVRDENWNFGMCLTLKRLTENALIASKKKNTSSMHSLKGKTTRSG